MNNARLDTIEQIREFLAGTAGYCVYSAHGPGSVAWLRRNGAQTLPLFRAGQWLRGVLFAYMHRLSGYSRQHLSRLIAQYRNDRSLQPASRASRTSFSRRVGPADTALLADIDRLHDTLSGPATKVLS